MMIPSNFDAFKTTLNNRKPAMDWPLWLKSLWYAAKQEWDASHDIAQDLDTTEGSWIHAHLHRVEGDKFNAQYWYSQARKPYCDDSFENEIRQIFEDLSTTS